MFRRWLDRYNRFMYGRYGADPLFYTMLVAAFVLNLFNRLLFRSILVLTAADVIFVLALLRYFSKNIYRRREENRKFCAAFAAIKREWQLLRDRVRDRKVCRYRKCKYCRAILRLPTDKGKHSVNCPACHKRFDVHIRF